MTRGEARDRTICMTKGEKISAALMGHAVSVEARKKIGEASRGRVPSVTTRKRLSESLKAARPPMFEILPDGTVCEIKFVPAGASRGLGGFATPRLVTLMSRVVFEDHPEGNGCWPGHVHAGPYGYTREMFQLCGGELTEEKPLTCHECDNPPCIRPDHLFAGSYSDNVRDAQVKGRFRSPFADPEIHQKGVVTRWGQK